VFSPQRLCHPKRGVAKQYDCSEARRDASFFVQGLGQTQTINAAEVCGGASQVAKVERIQTPLNWFMGLITLGIYTPLTAKVYCS
jgi:hypothetical protein